MAFRSSLSKLPGTLAAKLALRSTWLGAAILFGMVAASASGCGGCDDASVVCDDSGKNCQICDGYGCHPADPNAKTGSGGSSGTSGTTTAGNGGVGGSTTTATGTGGAPPDCDPSKAACACPTDGPCAEGLACIDGVCAPGCNFSYECGPGKVCLNGGCTAGCDAQTPCDPGYVCDKGACVVDGNNPQCSAQVPCPNNQLCVGGLCTSGCTSNAQCAMDEICDGTQGVCIADPSPHKSCSDDVKCTGAGQVCLNDGFCHYSCNTVNDCKLIDNRFVACDAQICKTAEEVEPECTLTKSCPPGKDCVSNKCL